MLSFTFGDIEIGSDLKGVVRLRHTKSGQRVAAFEVATINDPVVGMMWRKLLDWRPKGTHKDHYIFSGSPNEFYTVFNAAVRWLGLAEFNFKAYSLRRGGATTFYRRTKSMEETLNRGRWGNLRVARIYVNDGLAKEVELAFSDDQKLTLDKQAVSLLRWLQ